MQHNYDLTSAEIWQFLVAEFNLKNPPKPLTELRIKASKVERIVQEIVRDPSSLPEQAERLAKRIKLGRITFPFKTFSNEDLKVMLDALFESGQRPAMTAKKHRVEVIKMVPACEEDFERSHMHIDGKVWAVNHNYQEFWRPLQVDGHVAVIENPTGSLTPGHLIDHCTKERLNSSWIGSYFVSPVKAWEKCLPRVCKKLLNDLAYEFGPYIREEVPAKWKDLEAKDFRKACISEFPCSFHFPPTSLHATLSFLNTLTPKVFEEGCRMLDVSAGHGHRLAGALSCPKITFMAATDPNTGMMPGYREIYSQIHNFRPEIDANLTIESSGEPFAGFKGKRQFKIYEGKAEDPRNPIYQHSYNLVFSSPPFFNTESYGDGEGQSIKSFNTFEKWIDGFLRPMLFNSWKVLCNGGYVALNLTDTQDHKTVAALMQIVTQELHGTYLGMIPSRKATGASRWTSKEDREVKIHQGIDPIWVFRKEN